MENETNWFEMLQTGCADASEQQYAAKELEQLRAIVATAWRVRTEATDYNPCPDLTLRRMYRSQLHMLLDAWKAAVARLEKQEQTDGK